MPSSRDLRPVVDRLEAHRIVSPLPMRGYIMLPPDVADEILAALRACAEAQEQEDAEDIADGEAAVARYRERGVEGLRAHPLPCDTMTVGSADAIAALSSTPPPEATAAPAAADRNPRIADLLRELIGHIERGDISIGKAAQITGSTIGELIALHAQPEATAAPAAETAERDFSGGERGKYYERYHKSDDES